MAKKPEKKPVVQEEVQEEKKVPTEVEFINKIKAAKSLKELDVLNDEAIKLFGAAIPDIVNDVADAKFKELHKKESEPEKDSNDPSNWVKVTIEEKDKAEREGRLVGWNPRTNEALIK